MKKMKWLLPSLLLAMACGSETEEVAPDAYFAAAEQQFDKADTESKAELNFVTHPEVAQWDKNWGGIVAYLGSKPAVIRLIGTGSNTDKWNIVLDTTSGKVLYAKQETTDDDGNKLIHRIAYRADTVAYGRTVNDDLSIPAGDARRNGADMNSSANAIIAAVLSDRTDYDAPSNEARRQHAQFIAFGPKGSWTLIVNPSTRQVSFTQKGSEPRNFAYGSPSASGNESIYSFNSTSGALRVTLTTVPCLGDKNTMPYTINIKDADKSFSGCGQLLQ